MYCECGCGMPTNLAKRSYKKNRIVKGQAFRFLLGHQFNLPDSKERRIAGIVKLRGEGNPAWKGNDASGDAGRFRARSKFQLKECESCGKKSIDRHHRDGNPLNNDPPNVRILCRKCHMIEDGRASDGITCKHGHLMISPNIYVYPSGILGCKACRREAVRRWRGSRTNGQSTVVMDRLGA